MLMGEMANLRQVQASHQDRRHQEQRAWRDQNGKQMVMEGTPEFGVELQPIDFAKVAEGFWHAGSRGG